MPEPERRGGALAANWACGDADLLAVLVVRYPPLNGLPMQRRIHDEADLEWLVGHTRAFRAGRIAEVHIRRRHLFDENRGVDVLAETTIVLQIRYAVRQSGEPAPGQVQRWATLTCQDVTDFSFFEQEGTDSGRIDTLQTEWKDGRMRFWFDQYGEVYVVCQEAALTEIEIPAPTMANPSREWVFQAEEGTLPTVTWLLGELDRTGCPCVWRASGEPDQPAPEHKWRGLLSWETNEEGSDPLVLEVWGWRVGTGFAIHVRLPRIGARETRVSAQVAEILTRHFPGGCRSMASADTPAPSEHR